MEGINMSNLEQEQQIIDVLKEVDDPELIDVSVYELGMVHSITV